MWQTQGDGAYSRTRIMIPQTVNQGAPYAYFLETDKWFERSERDRKAFVCKLLETQWATEHCSGQSCKSFLRALDKNIKGPSSISFWLPRPNCKKKVPISIILFCSEYLPQGSIYPWIEWRHYFRGHMPRSSLFVMCSLLSSILSPKHSSIFLHALAQPEFQNIL